MDLPNMQETSCTGLGLLIVGVGNYFTGRPIISRLPRYAVFGAGGFMIGHLINKRVEKGVREREIIIFDYIKNHPEDFPEYQPKKFKEVLDTWHPIR